MSAAPSSKSLLARYLERCRTELPEDDIPARPPRVEVEASDAQQQLWLHSQLAGNIPLYNEAVTIHCDDELDIPSFERAFNHILCRHEAWRTVYQWRDNKLLQKVLPQLYVSIPFVDLRSEASGSRDHVALELASRDALPPIDVSKAPLFRPLLVRLSDRKFRFYITLHHMIFDGVSLYQIFLPELQASYNAFKAGSKPRLPDLPIQYADYCFAQKRMFQQERIRNQMQYWEQQLRGDLPCLKLPLDRPRPSVRNFRGEMETFKVSRELTESLRRLGQEHGVTTYMTFLAAFHVLLHHETGGDCDQLIGSVTSTRDSQKTERLLGFFLNTIVLRTVFRPDQSFLELLAKVREVTLNVLSNEVPFGVLVQQFGKNRTAGVSPLFQVMFSLEPALPLLDPGWRLTQMDVETGTSKFDLYLELDDRSDGLIGRFTYATDILSRATIVRMRRLWTNLLSLIAENPLRTVAQFPASLADSEAPAPTSGRRSFWRFLHVRFRQRQSSR